MTSVRRSLAISLAERYVLIAISLLGNILLARLLTPEQIGIYSVNLAVIGIAQVLRDFGVGNFLIQEKNLKDSHLRTAFGFSLVIGGSLFVMVLGLAPTIARFYSDDRLAETLVVSALNFLVLPFCTISLSLLRREMAFGRLVTVNVFAAIVGLVVTITLAYRGLGPLSMAIGSVVLNVATGIGAWTARKDYRLLLPGFSEWRTMLNFGTQSSAAGIVTAVAIDINDLAIGKLLGFAPVAMLSRAQGLMYLFHRDLMSAVRNVAYPAFAAAHREGASLEQRYIESVSNVTAFAWPFYGFTALFALEIMRLMFGPQWDEAASLVPIFCLAGAFAAVNNLITSLMMAVGRIDLVTKSELLFQPLRLSIVVGAALFFESILACAVAYLVSFALYTPMIYWFKARCIKSDTASLLAGLGKSLSVSVMTLAVPAIVALYSGLGRSEPVPFSVFGVAIVGASVSWVFAIIVVRHSIKSEPAFLRMTKWLPTIS